MVMCMLGPAQIVLLAALALIVFGPKRLPEIGRSLGNALREFQRASAEFMDSVNRPVEEQEPEPPPVKNIEYPTLQAAPGAEQYAALPYGSDFGSDSPGAPHAASHPAAEAHPPAAEPAAEGAVVHPETSAGAEDQGIAASAERKS